MEFESVMELVTHAFEAIGVAIFVVGSIVAGWRWARLALQGESRQAYVQLRQDVGRTILLGLEVLIIADIIETITVDLTIDSAVILGIIVLVRTFLSFSLEIELEGVVPWRKRASRGPAGEERDGGQP